MSIAENMPRLGADFEVPAIHSSSEFYLAFIKNAIRQMLPERFLELYRQGPQAYDHLRRYTHQFIPLIHATPASETPGNFSFLILSRYRPSALNFFYETFRRSLFPGEGVDIPVVCCVDFSFPEFARDEVFMLTEIIIHIKSHDEMEEIQRKLPLIKAELAMCDELHKNSETKELKTTAIQERQLHPVFMHRNEEEVLRNMLALGSEIKYLSDMPQMFISFDEQASQHLLFTVILVRVMLPDSVSIQEMFRHASTCLEYIHDRCKTIGYIRKKHPKKATVFRIKLPKGLFLRSDYSIDLYKARQKVVSEIFKVIGDVRDYNGGMISKQNELLTLVKDLLKGGEGYHDLLLENFFYSLHPVIMQTVLDPEILKKIFTMHLRAVYEGVPKDESYSMQIRAEPNAVYVMIGAQNLQVESRITSTVEKMKIPAAELVTSCVHGSDLLYFGYIYRTEDPQKQRQFCVKIQHALEASQLQRGAR